MSPAWEPIPATERYEILDLIRGFSLFGVLMVNLLHFFRVSLSRICSAFPRYGRCESHHRLARHTIPGVQSLRPVLALLRDRIAVQAERAASRGVAWRPSLLRRFLILLAFGAIHITLISNVDILVLYAVCGLMVIPLLRLPIALLAIVGLAAICLPGIDLDGTAARVRPPNSRRECDARVRRGKLLRHPLLPLERNSPPDCTPAHHVATERLSASC